MAKTLGLPDVTYIPMSALKGDNIVERSEQLSWYEGESLLTVLENIRVEHDVNLTDARFPVQYVIRPQTDALHDYRGYAGRISSGIYRKGDEVVVLPSGLKSRILRVEKDGREVEEAFAPQSVVLHLEDDLDVSRGDVIVRAGSEPALDSEFDVLLCWMDNKPLAVGNRYLLQHNSRTVKAVVRDIAYRLDVNTLAHSDAPASAALNDVVRTTIKTSEPLAFDSYRRLRSNGGAILIDQTSLVTVGACMIQ